MADKVVDVPGLGVVSFPDSMDDESISKAIQSTLHAEPEPPAGLTKTAAGREAYRSQYPQHRAANLAEATQGLDPGNPLLNTAKFLGAPATGLMSVPGQIADFVKRGFHNDPYTMPGVEGDNPVAQAYSGMVGLGTMALPEIMPSGSGVGAAMSEGLGTGIRKIPGVSIPLDMLDAYRRATAPQSFGPNPAPRSVPLPPSNWRGSAPAEPVPVASNPAPGVTPIRGWSPPGPASDGTFRIPNPIGMPPRAPQPVESIQPLQPVAESPMTGSKSEQNWNDVSRQVHSNAQDLELPGSPAGKSGHSGLSKAAKDTYGVKSWAELEPEQAQAIGDFIRKNKRWPNKGEIK